MLNQDLAGRSERAVCLLPSRPCVSVDEGETVKKNQSQKRMVLSRETLRNLATNELGGAGGGTTGCGGTSSGYPCTDTGISDCHCPSTAGTCTSLNC